MLLNLFFKYTSSLPLPYSQDDYAKLVYWENGPGASAGIAGLLIRRSNHQYYLQFGPKSMQGVADRDFSSLMSGTEGHFVGSLNDAQLIEGLRRHQDELPTNISSTDFFEMGDGEKLALAKKSFTHEKQAELRQAGKPTYEITLRNLDLDTMVELLFKIQHQECPLYAPFAGTILHQTNTENCASVVARVLEAGGANKVAPPLNDELTWVMPIPILVMAASNNIPILESAGIALAATLFARFMGGVAEGWQAANGISQLMLKEHKPYAASATWGLRALEMGISGVIATLTWGSPTRKILVLPEILLEWARKIEAVNLKQESQAAQRGQMHPH